MIFQKEIASIAEAKKVAKSTIDKDWALGHFIDAIYSIEECRNALIFKGGTCLKKCYFPEYRFSEDLDFTSLKSDFELTGNLVDQIRQIVLERSGILSHTESIRELRFNNEKTGYEAIITFWGADHPKNIAPPAPNRWHTKIKLEIILYEKLVFPAASHSIFHNFSDQLSENSKSIPCYPMEEILAEKLRALIQRSYTAPRDVYDLWYLSENHVPIDFHAVVKAFREKMKFKNIEFTGINQFLNEENDKKLRAAWKNSLGHQIPGGELPEFDELKNKLLELFKKIFNK